MAELRYVIIDERACGNEFIDVLESGTTEEEARMMLERSWGYLTDREKRNARMSLALMACEDGILLDAEECPEASDNGWDTLSAWTPIEEKRYDL